MKNTIVLLMLLCAMGTAQAETEKSATAESQAPAQASASEEQTPAKVDGQAPERDGTSTEVEGADEATEQKASKKGGKDKKKRGEKKDGKSAKAGKGLQAYPLDICIVTDNKLGSMGDPMTFTHADHEIKVCCEPCEKKFVKDPEKYLTKIKVEG